MVECIRSLTPRRINRCSRYETVVVKVMHREETGTQNALACLQEQSVTLGRTWTTFADKQRSMAETEKRVSNVTSKPDVMIKKIIHKNECCRQTATASRKATEVRGIKLYLN